MLLKSKVRGLTLGPVRPNFLTFPGGLEAGKLFVESLKLITLAVSLGGAESLIEHVPKLLPFTKLSKMSFKENHFVTRPQNSHSA